MKTIILFFILFLLTIVNTCAQNIDLQAGFSSTSARYKFKDEYRFENLVFNPGFK